MRLLAAIILIAPLCHAAEIKLSWRDNSSNEDGFEIERATGNIEVPWEVVATVPANVTEYTDTGLDLGKSYTYRVWAYNAGGRSQGPTNEASGVARDPLPERPESAGGLEAKEHPKPYRPIILQIGVTNTVHTQ